MITEKQFGELMSELLKIKKDINQLNKSFKKFDPDWNYISFGRYETLVVKALESVLDDKNGWIGYFLYERSGQFTNQAIIKDKDGKKIPFETMADLYNLIISK